jgi:hypothetical protein
MINFDLLKLHSRKTIKELLKLENQLKAEIDTEKKEQIQNKIYLCESLRFKDYKLFIS